MGPGAGREGEHLQLMCFTLFFFFFFVLFLKTLQLKFKKIKSLFLGDFSSWLSIPHFNKKALWARAGGEG